jgi:hypothetical protein
MSVGTKTMTVFFLERWEGVATENQNVNLPKTKKCILDI